jgi:hypothetical protein
MFGDECRFVSNETSSAPASTLVLDKRTGRLVNGGLFRVSQQLGQYCNNACDWVKNLHYCPTRWTLANPPKPKPKDFIAFEKQQNKKKRGRSYGKPAKKVRQTGKRIRHKKEIPVTIEKRKTAKKIKPQRSKARCCS